MVDPDAIHASREALRNSIATAVAGELLAAHRSDGAGGDDLSPRAKGVRRLRTVAQHYDTRLRTGFSDTELDTLRGLLARLRDNVTPE